MRRFAFLSMRIFIGVATLIQLAAPCALLGDDTHEEKYPFVRLKVGNQPERNVCLGIAGAIACLEEATDTDGVANVVEVADRIWKKLHAPELKFTYSKFALLRDGTRVPTCSEAALQDIALLLQTKYEDIVSNELWQTDVEPDPKTSAGRALLKTRYKYEARYQTKISSRLELKTLIENDNDALVPLAGQGVREFQNVPPQNIIDKFNLTIDARTQSYPAVPTHHAFLITYDKKDDSFYVYDSDDPDRRWLAFAHRDGDRFMLDWHIDDHMGNGPTRQVYFALKPLPELLAYFQRILKE